MTNTKHTPGPWKVARQNPSPTTSEWMISGAKPGYLAEVRDCGSGDVKANARLIAAAPSLLDALAMFVNAVDSWQDDDQPQDASDFIALIETTAEAARDAIAQATGDQS